MPADNNMARVSLVGICGAPSGDHAWWSADSVEDPCPNCPPETPCSPYFYAPRKDVAQALDEVSHRIHAYHEKGFTVGYVESREIVAEVKAQYQEGEH